jgi:hypothetical protein
MSQFSDTPTGRRNPPMRFKGFAAVVFVTMLAVQAATAATIAQWNYNDRNTGVDLGSGTQFLVGGFPIVGFLNSTDPNDPAGYRADDRYLVAALNYGAATGKGLGWAASTAGFAGLSFSLDIMPGLLAPRLWHWEVSIDGGGSWNAAGQETVARNRWNTIDLDLSPFAHAANNPLFQVRLIASEDGAGSVSFDWINLNGTPVPLPAPILLLASGLFGLVMIRRRSQQPAQSSDRG